MVDCLSPPESTSSHKASYDYPFILQTAKPPPEYEAHDEIT